jgi:rhodanese-related sulfurtransferase
MRSFNLSQGHFKQKTPLKVAAVLCATALLPALATGLLHPRKPDWSYRAPRSVDMSEVEQWNIEPLWVDVRSTELYNIGHMPDAISLAIDGSWTSGLRELAGKWIPSQPLVVYCERQWCLSSRDAANRLRHDLGTQDVFVLREGWPVGKQPAR